MVENSTASEWAGWIGAITGCLALAWEIITWFRSGPRLSLKVHGNMKHWNENNGESKETFISIQVSNRGDSSTKMNGLHLFHYTSFVTYLFSRPSPEAYLIVLTPLRKRIKIKRKTA